jgi:hypothetical protein
VHAPGLSGLRDQLDRASISIVLNIADIVIGRGLATAPACQQARSLRVRIVQMLTRLNARMAASA